MSVSSLIKPLAREKTEGDYRFEDHLLHIHLTALTSLVFVAACRLCFATGALQDTLAAPGTRQETRTNEAQAFNVQHGCV